MSAPRRKPITLRAPTPGQKDRSQTPRMTSVAMSNSGASVKETRIISPTLSDSSSTSPQWSLTGGVCALCFQALESLPGGLQVRHAESLVPYSECEKRRR